MTAADTLDFARESIYLLITIAAPAMLTALIVGVVIGLLQALTQIQEQTLVFVPKILAIFLVLLIALPFAVEAMATYMDNVAARIAQP
jgi:flagellar biosynthetic protein FliQ